MPTLPTQQRQLLSVIRVTWVVTRHLVATLPTRAPAMIKRPLSECSVAVWLASGYRSQAPRGWFAADAALLITHFMGVGAPSSLTRAVSASMAGLCIEIGRVVRPPPTRAVPARRADAVT